MRINHSGIRSHKEQNNHLRFRKRSRSVDPYIYAQPPCKANQLPVLMEHQTLTDSHHQELVYLNCTCFRLHSHFKCFYSSAICIHLCNFVIKCRHYLFFLFRFTFEFTNQKFTCIFRLDRSIYRYLPIYKFNLRNQTYVLISLLLQRIHPMNAKIMEDIIYQQKYKQKQQIAAKVSKGLNIQF